MGKNNRNPDLVCAKKVGHYQPTSKTLQWLFTGELSVAQLFFLLILMYEWHTFYLNIYFQLDYLPEAKGLSGKKKVVVSNCRQVEAFANDPSGTGPSLEVAIENREISFFAMTPNGQILLKTDISVRYFLLITIFMYLFHTLTDLTLFMSYVLPNVYHVSLQQSA